jgi:hypothetical protein
MVTDYLPFKFYPASGTRSHTSSIESSRMYAE